VATVGVFGFMRFGLLGPLLADDGMGERPVPAARQRALLAALLLRANQVVDCEELARSVWPGEPPAAARTTLQGYVLRLRRQLGAAAARLVTQGSGYRVEVQPDELDLHLFARLVAEAEQAAADRRWTDCRTRLGAGLDLWRGTPLQDVAGIAGHAELVRHWTEARLQALELRLQAELELGQHRRALIELGALAHEHPLRERVAGQLMLALYRSERQAEALEVYQRTRRTLIEQLGVDPGRALQQLHRQILHRDPELDAPTAEEATAEEARSAPGAAPAPGSAPGAQSGAQSGASASAADPGAGTPAAAAPTPAQLPSVTEDFTGRTEPAAELLAHLGGSADPDGGAPRSAVVTGQAGIGKTALALHTAHRLRDRFPDGQLFAALAGAGPDPVPAHEVQGWFLRALGTAPQAVPAQPEERTAFYRSVLATRRVLIVLDDARDAAQVRDLMPGSGASAVLLTSRQYLVELANTRSVTLTTLPLDEGRSLFERIVGPERAQAEPGAVAAVLGSCSGLPLAIRIAGARLATRPQWSIRLLADRLADSDRTLSELTAGELSVRSGLALGYAGLRGDGPAEAAAPGPAVLPGADGGGIGLARCFRLLGLSGLAQFDAAAAAPLFGVPVDRAEELLEALVDRRLLELPYGGLYRFHDLTRLYAEEMAQADEPPADRTLAFDRLLSWYLSSAEAAAALLRPGGRPAVFDPAVPSWESYGGPWGMPLIHTADQALEWFEAERSNLVALSRRAYRNGTVRFCWQVAEAMRHYFIVRRHWADWISAFETGLAAAEDAGEQLASARMCDGLGTAYLDLRRFEKSAEVTRVAIDAYHLLGRSDLQAMALSNLTGVLAAQGQHQEGTVAVRQALVIQLEAEDLSAASVSLGNLGMLQIALGEAAEAVESYLEGLLLARKVGHRYAEAAILSNLGEAYLSLEAYPESIAYCREALEVCTVLGTEHGRAVTLSCLGQALDRTGRPAQAKAALTEALEILDRLRAPDAEAARAALAALDRTNGPRPDDQ